MSFHKKCLNRSWKAVRGNKDHYCEQKMNLSCFAEKEIYHKLLKKLFFLAYRHSVWWFSLSPVHLRFIREQDRYKNSSCTSHLRTTLLCSTYRNSLRISLLMIETELYERAKQTFISKPSAVHTNNTRSVYLFILDTDILSTDFQLQDVQKRYGRKDDIS